MRKCALKNLDFLRRSQVPWTKESHQIEQYDKEKSENGDSFYFYKKIWKLDTRNILCYLVHATEVLEVRPGSAACSVGDRQSEDLPEQLAVAGLPTLPGAQKPGNKVFGPSLTPKKSVGDRFLFFLI
jgi:hypothetical protein